MNSENTSSPAYVYANDSEEEFIHWIDVAAQANNRSGVVNNAASYSSSFYTYVSDGTLLEGLGAAYTDATYTNGLLTGVYADTAAPVGSFVLQNNDKVGFYFVAEGKQPTVGANHAYLTEEAGARAAYFFGEGVTNGINAIEALTEGNVGIFNAAGVQQPRLQKGLNIVKKADGTSFKVMVK